MSQQEGVSTRSSFFDLTVDGVGYLNRVRSVKPKKGAEFLACTVSAMRGNVDDLSYTKFDCRVSGADARTIVRQLEADVDPDGQVKFPHPWPPQIPPGRTGQIMTTRG